MTFAENKWKRKIHTLAEKNAEWNEQAMMIIIIIMHTNVIVPIEPDLSLRSNSKAKVK